MHIRVHLPVYMYQWRAPCITACVRSYRKSHVAAHAALRTLSSGGGSTRCTRGFYATGIYHLGNRRFYAASCTTVLNGSTVVFYRVKLVGAVQCKKLGMRQHPAPPPFLRPCVYRLLILLLQEAHQIPIPVCIYMYIHINVCAYCFTMHTC